MSSSNSRNERRILSLTPTCAPTFEFNPVKKQLLGAKDGRVLIECKPRAAPRPRFIWKKGDELLFNSTRISVMIDGTLEIRNATKNDEGLYTCFLRMTEGRPTTLVISPSLRLPASQ
ncbi:hypothetical protein OJAV_G00221520 [Oryzias javanicus]|uniref:Ig-like domain-containing protein n=1 Tax=Oryzias javanicus TaxID=123683 RepID=A0A3S2LYJ9_ORYJA|nr:hypothetical protein OJAV_G00221520 [Oryzias javanicus]